MDMNSTKQYLQELQKEYLGADKKQKGLLLDEAKKRTGRNRKYLTCCLGVSTNWNKIRKNTVRENQYTTDLILPLVKLWDIFDRPCGQRFKTSIFDELKRLREFGEIDISDEQAQKLLEMCPKTIDTLLSHEKEVRHLKEKYNGNKNTLLYQKIPTKLSDEWDRNLLGQIQIDAVEHCGQTTAGDYANTISNTDISSHWWEGEAVMGKGKTRTLEAIKLARSRFPFAWQEIHPDNGTSFINYFVYDYANENKLEFSRSRPYKKNDNCFVEQKNSQNVRKVVGHVRYDTKREAQILNDLYRNELRLYKNFFQPVMRLETKIRNKGHIYRKYQKAKTPYRWLMDSKETPTAEGCLTYMQKDAEGNMTKGETKVLEPLPKGEGEGPEGFTWTKNETPDYTLVEFALGGDFKIEDLGKVIPPDVDPSKPVIISGRGPLYLTHTIAAGYRHYKGIPGVGFYQPASKFGPAKTEVGISHDEELPLGLNFGEPSEIGSAKEQYKKRISENLNKIKEGIEARQVVSVETTDRTVKIILESGESYIVSVQEVTKK